MVGGRDAVGAVLSRGERDGVEIGSHCGKREIEGDCSTAFSDV